MGDRNRVAQLVEQEEYSSSGSGFDSRLYFLLLLYLDYSGTFSSAGRALRSGAAV